MSVRRWLPTLAIWMASVSLAVSVVLAVDALNHRDDICVSRNEERAVQRANLQDQIEQTEGLSEEVFRQFDITRQESLDALERRKAKLRSLDCG